jgi:plasmid stabilization system protein ParE
MRIIWSDTAKADVKDIYNYYKEKVSSKVARSIRSKLIKKPRLLSKQPELGQEEDNPVVAGRGFRYLVEGNYKIVYKVFTERQEILIATVFDTRQNPNRLNV